MVIVFIQAVSSSDDILGGNKCATALHVIISTRVSSVKSHQPGVLVGLKCSPNIILKFSSNTTYGVKICPSDNPLLCTVELYAT